SVSREFDQVVRLPLFAAPLALTHPNANDFRSITVGDFNGDGKADFAVTEVGGNVVTVFIGNGDGTFASPVSYPVGSHPLVAVTADFNGDGNLDLAVSVSDGGGVAVLLGNGNGNFGTAVTYATGSTPTGLLTADFNGDRKPDLAVANAGSNNISVL